ncbi:hypothetical protein A2872_01160 [Candidatus Gottesmanbacteria bacterium RIFCSPHIGHO2_01_FULL_42_12]|uniref:Uncharacterized protein n=1 Tax=Candidatus Gottesmanbacteria bacterium RIFCSPHIGHO2_01_FULL_42_12 TaxID=1798377 RepID=A0A1F5Z1I2_9BACT|nr:MAG: hypothetical protein A2872_01160 [Candidatus Gottesmanbacteria bacterium RIFCSPHIGHO2_01_FULL_42_12]
MNDPEVPHLWPEAIIPCESCPLLKEGRIQLCRLADSLVNTPERGFLTDAAETAKKRLLKISKAYYDEIAHETYIFLVCVALSESLKNGFSRVRQTLTELKGNSMDQY